MKTKGLAAALCGSALLLSGCAGSIERTNRVATDYNRVFAKARNEQLLLNVLRAWRREPLMFSTMGTVSGGIRSTASLRIPFANIVLGPGDETINPELSLGGGLNPTVTFTPLGTKEFTQGILRPVTPETVDFLLGQGMHHSVVVPMLVGGVQCSDGFAILNHGNDDDVDREFYGVTAAASEFSVVELPRAEFTRLRMSAADARTLLQTGAGEGRVVTRVTHLSEWPPAAPVAAAPAVAPPAAREAPGLSGDVIVEISRKTGVEARGISPSPLCSKRTEPQVALAPDSSGRVVPLPSSPTRQPGEPAGATGLVMRSVGSMFRYLAEIHERNVQYDRYRCGEIGAAPSPPPPSRNLFKIHMACRGHSAPYDAFASVEFDGRVYYIPADRDAPEADRTLEVFSLLSDLIALQTSESTIQATTPLITVRP